MEDPDLSARKHLAGSDPAFPARREEAWGRIVAALNIGLAATVPLDEMAGPYLAALGEVQARLRAILT